MNSKVLPPPLPQHGFIQRYGTLVRMITIFLLVMVLLVPLTMIQSVLSERQQRMNEALSSITATWGGDQTITGPVLTVPYRYHVKTWKESLVKGQKEKVEQDDIRIARATFLPASLQINGKLDPNVLHRGIYDATVYRGSFVLSGSFNKPVFDEWKVKDEDVMWEEATVSFMITDLRGASEALVLKWGKESLPLVLGSKFQEFPSGLHARVGLKVSESGTRKAARGWFSREEALTPVFEGASKSFELSLTLNGGKSVSFAPVGAQNEVRIVSAWQDPSFHGSFLPAERKLAAEGFEANWRISNYGRTYPQQWATRGDESNSFVEKIAKTSLFGVSLISVVDSYRCVERSIKYGVLFIVLVFTAFFLFEILSGLRIHPFQYTLVGVAMCLFYLALLSLSEIIDFNRAYLAGALLASGMVTFYSGYILKSYRRAAIIGAGLAVIYGFLYIILRQQDYSLVYGTVGLFIVLAIVMYATRNIDWYARDERLEAEEVL